jgi:tRNA(fMet)-specific endonuclease VapC
MNRLMLDTNAVRALVDGHSPRLDGWFADQRCCISVIVAAEILYGLEKNALNARKRQLIEKGLAGLEVLPWTEACACVYGRLRAALQRQGRPLALMDLLIASHALTEGCALVTADQAFANVAELTLESW